MTNYDKFPIHGIEKYSCSKNIFSMGIDVIKQRNYIIRKDVTLTGDAPKVFVAIHRNGDNPYRRKNINKWPLYIAKTGHKWYPNESITEYLLNRLGSTFGLQMAECDIVIINNQLRFISKYFLRPDQEELVHGAEIFGGYLGDSSFVKEIEYNNLSQDLFTLQFVEKSLKSLFPNDYKAILNQLVRLLLFDALVGNNDRHYYNWAIIRPFSSKKSPRFSPIYDTARGLFWNFSDDNLRERLKSNKNFIHKYSNSSRPKLGWDGEKSLNHFNLVKLICQTHFYIEPDELHELFRKSVLDDMINVVRNDFSRLYSPFRISVIEQCLQYRFTTIQNIISNET